MDAYTSFAEVYDMFMDNIPYEDWCGYLTSLLKEYGINDGLVQPCRRIALFFFFRCIWAAVSLIIFNAGRKFLPGILGEVVQKSLAVQPYRKAVFHDLAFMFRDRQKMMIRIVNIIHFPTSFPFSFLLFYPPYSGLTTPLSFAAFWKIPVTGHTCVYSNKCPYFPQKFNYF
jgi:hypothetical protein